MCKKRKLEAGLTKRDTHSRRRLSERLKRLNKLSQLEALILYYSLSLRLSRFFFRIHYGKPSTCAADESGHIIFLKDSNLELTCIDSA